MATQGEGVWTWSQNQGLQQRGQALILADGQTIEADNCAWLGEAALQMRLGSADEDLTGSGLTGELQWLFSFLPSDGAAEELWAAANNAGTVAMARRVSGTWSPVVMSDAANASSLPFMQGAVLNGKLFIAYDSSVNRLHVWDGTSLRRVGLSKPSAPSVADTGAGSYTNTARRYRVSMRIKDGDDIIAESELSDATSFTPSGSGTAARVTKPTTVDSATHWVIWGLIGSSGDVYDLYEELTELAVGTTTYDDSTAPASYDGDFPPELGQNIPPPSAKYILSDGSRLLMGGRWETSGAADETEPKVNRVWFTRNLGETDRGDDESIPNALTQVNRVDVGDAGGLTGLGGPLFSSIYVFKSRVVYKLRPTGDPVSPYAVLSVSTTCGAVDQRVICAATNESGAQEAIFFADEHAAYRISDGGLSDVGFNIARDLRAQAIVTDTSYFAYDPYQKHVLLIVSSSPSSRAGSYNAFLGDVLKQRWSGFSLGGAQGGWTLGASALGIDTILAGGGSSIKTATIAIASDTSTRRLIVGGQDATSVSSLTAIGTQCVMDGTTAFTTRARVRRMLKPGFSATVFNPTIWYRNPQGSTSGTLTCTLQFLRPAGPDGESTVVSSMVTLDATTDESGIELRQHTFTDVQWTDLTVVDVRVSLTYSGTAFASAYPPSIDIVALPYRIQEPLSR